MGLQYASFAAVPDSRRATSATDASIIPGALTTKDDMSVVDELVQVNGVSMYKGSVKEQNGNFFWKRSDKSGWNGVFKSKAEAAANAALSKVHIAKDDMSAVDATILHSSKQEAEKYCAFLNTYAPAGKKYVPKPAGEYIKGGVRGQEYTTELVVKDDMSATDAVSGEPLVNRVRQLKNFGYTTEEVAAELGIKKHEAAALIAEAYRNGMY